MPDLESLLVSVHDRLCFAIKNKRLIQFEYRDCRRIAEPHDYGMFNGIEQVLVYQLRGETKSKRLPDWRFIRVAGMKRLKVLEDTFPGGRAVPSAQHKKWDELFIRVSSPRAPIRRKRDIPSIAASPEPA
jgi:hypothetical protein